MVLPLAMPLFPRSGEKSGSPQVAGRYALSFRAVAQSDAHQASTTAKGDISVVTPQKAGVDARGPSRADVSKGRPSG